MIQGRLRQLPVGTGHLPHRYDGGSEIKDQAMSAGLSGQQVPERKAHSEILEKFLRHEQHNSSGSTRRDSYYYETPTREDVLLLKARFLYDDFDLTKLSNIVRVSRPGSARGSEMLACESRFQSSTDARSRYQPLKR